MPNPAIPTGWRFNLGVAALVLEAISAVSLLAASAYLISRASEQPPILHLMLAVVGVRAFALGRGVFRYLQRLGLHDAILAHMSVLRARIFSSLSHSDQLSKNPAADLERLTGDIDRAQDYSLKVLAPLVQTLVAVAYAATLVAVWFPLAGFIGLAISILSTAFIFFLTSAISAKNQFYRVQRVGELREQISEILTHHELLTSFEAVGRYRREIAQKGLDVAKSDRSSGTALGLIAALLGLAAIITSASTGYFSAAYPGQAPGHLLALALLTPLAIFDIANQLQGSATSLSASRFSIQRVRESLSKQASPGGTLELTKASELKLKNVRISIQGAMLPGKVNFELRPGMAIAVTGASGSGKTTLALMMSGLLPSAEGYLINGLEASEFSRESIANRILLIEQDPHLFAGTIRDNLLISGVDSEHRMLEALSDVNLLADVLPRGGLDTPASEFGSNLSGGQVQRIAIARALLHHCDFVVFDEPTSGLDWGNALNVAHLVQKLCSSGKGVIVITHDLEFAKLIGPEVRLDGPEHK